MMLWDEEKKQATGDGGLVMLRRWVGRVWAWTPKPTREMW